jgi:hypothetical protein
MFVLIRRGTAVAANKLLKRSRQNKVTMNAAGGEF